MCLVHRSQICPPLQRGDVLLHEHVHVPKRARQLSWLQYPGKAARACRSCRPPQDVTGVMTHDSRSNASQENASQTCSNAKSGATRDAERVRGGHCGFPGSCIGSHSRRVATHLIALRDSYLIFLILTALGNAAMAALGGRLGCTEFSFSACQELTCRLPTCRAQPALGPRALCVLALRLSS